MEHKWYRIDVVLGHQGNKEGIPFGAYVYVKDAVAAFNKFKYLPGLKKGSHLPTKVMELSESEGQKLERQILEEGYPLERAKRNQYYPQDIAALIKSATAKKSRCSF